MNPQSASAPLSKQELEQMHAWWRASNYLAVGMIYLKDNPLLQAPLQPEHVKTKEKGNINTPLELAIRNQIDRFNLVIDVVDRVPRLRSAAAHLKERMQDAIIDNLHYAHEFGTDRTELANWRWSL